MLQSEAKDKLMKEFDEWKQKNGFEGIPTESDALQFYAYIESDKPHLLNFKCAGDKWQKLKSWLYDSSRIRGNRDHPWS